MDRDEQDIRELIARWMQATKEGDLGAVLDLMSDDVVFLVPGQPPFGKHEYAAATRRQQATGMRIEGRSEIQEVQVVGDWAFVRTRLRVEIRMGDAGDPMIRGGHTLSVLRRESGRWRLARDANLVAPE